MAIANRNLPIVLTACVIMALVVFVSNQLVTVFVTPLNTAVGGEWFNYAQFTFPIAFLITDVINRTLGSKRAYMVIAAGFAVGGVMSIASAFGPEGMDHIMVRIGIASMIAFAIGQVLDVTVFNRLRQNAWWLAPLVSSLIASAIDTSLFYSIAFAGEQWPWVQQGFVDFGVKVLVALCALVPFRLLIARILGDRAAA